MNALVMPKDDPETFRCFECGNDAKAVVHFGDDEWWMCKPCLLDAIAALDQAIYKEASSHD